MNKTQRRDQMIETRAAYWAQKRPNWLSEPVARVEGALKFIEQATREAVQNAKGHWVMRNAPIFFVAQAAAEGGNGAFVNSVALRVLAHGK